jgi:hypothetical protein
MKSIIEYLKDKPSLKGQLYDHGELKRLARVCGISPEEARSELRKHGFILTKNDHGIAIWKRGGYKSNSQPRRVIQ